MYNPVQVSLVYETSTGGKPTEAEVDQWLLRVEGVGGDWLVTANGHRVSFPGDENALKLDFGDSCLPL